MSSKTFNLPERFADTNFGFLSVVELPSLGFCGGLLVVSAIGRPIEFHCTAPVKPNRTQEIMYGKTYRSYLFSDLIASALVEKLKAQPAIYLTDSIDTLALSETIDAPVVLLEDKETANEKTIEVDTIEILEHQCHLASSLDPSNRSLLLRHLNDFASKLPLDEPLERIAQAIEEAHTVLRAG